MSAVTDYPSPNFGYPQGEHGRSGQKVEAIVIHISEGSLASMRSWFGQPASSASSTYGIGKAGQRERYVKEDDSPWTNGDVKKADLSIPWLARAIEQGVNPNELTETIEGEGFYTEPVPEAKYQAILATVRERLAARGLTASKTTVIGHFQINGIDRANCPGPNFPWARLYHDLAVTANVGPKTKSMLLLTAWELGRKALADAGAPDPYGLYLFEATADLTGIAPTLPKAAQCLVCEKAVLWVGNAGAVDTMHRGQYEGLVTAGKVQEWR